MKIIFLLLICFISLILNGVIFDCIGNKARRAMATTLELKLCDPKRVCHMTCKEMLPSMDFLKLNSIDVITLDIGEKFRYQICKNDQL